MSIVGIYHGAVFPISGGYIAANSLSLGPALGVADGLALGFFVGAALLLMVGDGELLTDFLFSGDLVGDGSAAGVMVSVGVDAGDGSAETVGVGEEIGIELGAWIFEDVDAHADTEITETKEIQSLKIDVSFLLMKSEYLVDAKNI